MRDRVQWIMTLLLLVCTLSVGQATTARAAGTTYYVGTLIDATTLLTPDCRVATNTTCTLRAALALAADGDTIRFAPNASFGTYLLGTGAGQGTLTIAHSMRSSAARSR